MKVKSKTKDTRIGELGGLPLLKKGSLECPTCGQRLEFETVGMMRIIKEIDGVLVYDAVCPDYDHYYYVKSNNLPQ